MITKTPCEELGYKVGAKFTVKETTVGFIVGQEVTLDLDDGSATPLFSGENRDYNLCTDMYGNDYSGAYLDVSRVTPVSIEMRRITTTVTLTEDVTLAEFIPEFATIEIIGEILTDILSEEMGAGLIVSVNKVSVERVNEE